MINAAYKESNDRQQKSTETLADVRLCVLYFMYNSMNYFLVDLKGNC